MRSSRKRFFQCFRSILNPFFFTGCLSFRLNDQHKLEISFWTIVLTYFYRLIGLGSFITGWTYKVYSHQYSKTILELSPLLQLLGILELAASILAYINVSISMEFNKQMHAELFNKAYELDKVFIEKFDVSFNYGKEIRRNILNTRFLMLFCGVYCPICFISMDPDWYVVLMAFGYAMCTLGPLSSSVTHINLMNFLRIRFELFGSVFQKYFSVDLNENKEKQRHFVLLINHYRKYCELIHVVNSVYGHAAVVNYLHDFTQTSSIVFVLCHKALESETSGVVYIVLFMYVFPRMFKIVYMAFCARKTILELRSCLQIIGTYDDHCTSKNAKDTIDELIMWSKLNRFQFNVGSALELNFGLVYEFFLGIGNYILILIQLKFQETSIKERLVATVKKQ
ncbi:putative gustatory receptor 47b [Episyrphus balteatus]|uniref:putative gustatory receptor 47b n=1 Tax=Episyrphus balteatus TaxID=286459 RepID=UPI002485D32E|nr:putative gustatory receptor 47b [Episyrphus balteatus]